MKHLSLISTLLLLIAGSLSSQSTDYHAEVVPLSSEAYEGSTFVLEDRNGYIWSWKHHSIYRLDPHGAELISAQGLYPDFTGNRRLKLFEDRHGLIWILYGNATRRDDATAIDALDLDVLDPSTRKLKSAKEHFRHRLPFSERDILNIHRDAGGRLFFTTKRRQLFIYDGSFYLELTAPASRKFTQAYPASDSSYWLINDNELMEVNSRGRLLSSNTFSDSLVVFAPGADGGVWAASFDRASGSRLSRTSPSTPPVAYDLSSYDRLNGIFKLFVDRQERVWIGAPERLVVWTANEGVIADLTDRVYPDIYGAKNLFEICADRRDQVWIVGKFQQYLVNVRYNRFANYLAGKNISVRGITHWKDSVLWVNTYSGVFSWQVNAGHTEKIIDLYDPAHGRPEPVYGLGAQKDRLGNIWLGREGLEIVFRFNTDRQEMEALPLVASSKNLIVPIFPFTDRRGRIWIGHNKGMSYGSAESDRLALFTDYNDREVFADVTVQFMMENDEGIWTATDRGLFRIRPDSGIVGHFHHFPFNNIAHIYEDEEGIFWLSARGGGLTRWDRKKDEISQFTTREGLSQDNVHAVYEDDYGYLWLPTNRGLTRMHKASGRTRHYFVEDGLPDNEFNFLSHCQLPDGRLVFGGVNGFTVFDPKDFIEDDPAGYPLLVTQYQVLTRDGEWQDQTVSFQKRTRLDLPYRTPGFRFRFALMDFSSPGDLQYAYRMDGYDEEWIYTGDNTLKYNRLPHGHYRLRIKGRGRDGQWLENDLQIPVNVLPPWYFRTPVILAAILGLALLIWILWRRHIDQLRRKEFRLERLIAERTRELEKDRQTIARQFRELQEVNQAKDKLFTIIGHELRGPVVYFQNIAQNIAYLIRKGEFDRIESLGVAMQESLNHVNTMLDNLLHWGLLQTGRMRHHPQLLRLEREAAQVVETCEAIARMKGIRFVCQIPPGTDLFADRNAVLIILRNLLSNALKFTPRGGKVSLTVIPGDPWVEITVEDTGVGICPKVQRTLFRDVHQSKPGVEGEKGTGLGLHITYELILLNGGDIQVKSRENAGAVFIVKLRANRLVPKHRRAFI